MGDICKHSAATAAISLDLARALELDALSAVPLALRPAVQGDAHALKVEPLNGAVRVITPDHLTKRDALAVAVGGLVWIYHRNAAPCSRHLQGCNCAARNSLMTIYNMCMLV